MCAFVCVNMVEEPSGNQHHMFWIKVQVIKSLLQLQSLKI